METPLLTAAARLSALLFALTASLSAVTLDAEYSLSYGIFPAIGTTTLHYESADGRYRIVAEARLHGLAAILAHHHTERHISIGAIDAKGRLVPQRYETLRTMDGFRRERSYLFEQRHRYIIFEEHVDIQRKEKHFDPQTMHYVETVHPEKMFYRHIELYQAKDDLLSLYFNGRETLSALPVGETFNFAAAGAEHGIVKVTRQVLPLHFIFLLDQDIFRSKQGEVYVVTDEALYVKSAILKDVFLFGDLKVEREWLRTGP